MWLGSGRPFKVGGFSGFSGGLHHLRPQKRQLPRLRKRVYKLGRAFWYSQSKINKSIPFSFKYTALSGPEKQQGIIQTNHDFFPSVFMKHVLLPDPKMY